MSPPIELVQRISNQLPSGVAHDTIIAALQRNNGNELDALCELLGMKAQPPPPKSETQSMFDNMRRVCDSYDEAMQQVLRKDTKPFKDFRVPDT